MTDDPFRYDIWIENALRSVVRQALDQAAEEGLSGNHHFYITYQTDFPGVVMPDSLRAQYPEEITIVLQYEYWDLEVEDDMFHVTLSFNNERSPLSVPYEAITAFADPAVKFGLQLKMDGLPSADDEDLFGEDDLPPLAEEDPNETMPPAEPETAQEEKMGEVIDLGAFRKK